MAESLPETSLRRPCTNKWGRYLGVFVFVYVCGFGVFFVGDHLGRAPVLDGRENLAWSELIAQGQVPAEPFYRALLYPWCLSWLSHPLITAPLFGLACHFVNALLCSAIARLLWRSSNAALFCGLLYGAYPVALFFAVQVLDITFGISLFLVGLYAFLHGWRDKRYPWLVLSGFAAGLCVCARPNFLPPVLVLMALPQVLGVFEQRRLSGALHYWRSTVLLAAPIILVLGAQGWLNLQRSGEFHVLPWQGAYNLYAANREGANGKFYQQRIAFKEVPAGMNSTRMESEFLYQVEQGANAAKGVAEMNTYWRGQLLNEVRADPIRWFGLMGRKCYYLLNDWEQYNNLTYAYHKERFWLLRYNPLGWGLLMLGATVAVGFGWRQLNRSMFVALTLLAGAYAAGVLMFFVSARFRLPLSPLMCVACAGLVVISWRELRIRSVMLMLSAMAPLALLSYGGYWGARDTATFIQDEFLLASAAARCGDDVEALSYAELVLARDLKRDDARRIQIASLFNLWLAETNHAVQQHYEERLNASVLRIQDGDASTAFISGVCAWRSGDLDQALAIWELAVDKYGERADSSLIAVRLIHKKKTGEALTEEEHILWSMLKR